MHIEIWLLLVDDMVAWVAKALVDNISMVIGQLSLSSLDSSAAIITAMNWNVKKHSIITEIQHI